MTPGQLRSFVAVATTGSIQAAAGKLVVSQPAVSAAVSGLQGELGVPLLRKAGRGVVLTPAGAILADYGRRLLGLWEEALAATVASADPERGRLRLAAVTTAGEHVVPGLLATFRDAHPSVEIELEVGNRQRVWDLLRSGEADVAVGGRPPQGGSMVALAVAPNDLVVVATPTSGRRSRVRRVGIDDLAARTWLVREPGSGTRSTTEELFSETGIDPVRLTIGSNGAVRESVIAGLGIALLSRAAVVRDLREGVLEEWRAGPLPLRRSWHMAARAGAPLAPTAVLFCDHVVRPGSVWAPETGMAEVTLRRSARRREG